MNWIKKAIILGFVFFLAILVIRPIGVSTQFSVLSGILYKTVNPGIIWEDANSENGYASSNEYFNNHDGKLAKSIENPWNYEFVFVLAIPLGGYLGSLTYKKKGLEKPNPIQQSFIKQYGPSFLSGFILLYGARLADGCTSGHMMSGMMQGSLSGYVFAGSVFLVAIPTAILIGKYRDGKGVS